MISEKFYNKDAIGNVSDLIKWEKEDPVIRSLLDVFYQTGASETKQQKAITISFL